MAWIKRFDRDDAIKIAATLVLVGFCMLLFFLGRNSAEEAEDQSQRADAATTRATKGEEVATQVATADVCENKGSAAKAGMTSVCKAAASLAEEAEEEPLPGPEGPKGDPGEPGTDGEDGKDGLDGADGKDGLDGKDGIDGALGPIGPTGPVGPEGPAGPAGKDGADGKNGIDGDDGAGIKSVDVQCIPAAPRTRDGLKFTFTFTDGRPDSVFDFPEVVSSRAC